MFQLIFLTWTSEIPSSEYNWDAALVTLDKDHYLKGLGSKDLINWGCWHALPQVTRIMRKRFRQKCKIFQKMTFILGRWWFGTCFFSLNEWNWICVIPANYLHFFLFQFSHKMFRSCLTLTSSQTQFTLISWQIVTKSSYKFCSPMRYNVYEHL